MQQVWQIRQMIALAMLAISAYTDIKEKNIYLMPLIIPSAGAISISVISFANAGVSDERSILLYEMAIPVLAGILVIAAVKTGALGMGMGDGYLMAALGLIIGVKLNIFVILTAAVAASVYAAALFVSEKKRRRTMPFAPFVMAGYMILLINEI